jgi:hypothetical protein
VPDEPQTTPIHGFFEQIEKRFGYTSALILLWGVVLGAAAWIVGLLGLAPK